MDQITPSRITSWVLHWVNEFSTDEYQEQPGNAIRCNLNNEINMFVTIFNWYKESEEFEKEALFLTNPIKRKHRALSFIKPSPDKKKQISLEDAYIFFEYLKPLYKQIAMLQFYCAARIGEIAGLQWSNIDLKNRRMLIKHSSIFHPVNKTFLELKAFPKNKEPRPVYITDEILEILKRKKKFQIKGNNFVFHVEGSPLNYGTIQINYREAQRKGKLPYSGTHILRHGMATLARKIGGGLDAVIAMTGHKDIKLADHFSKLTNEVQKETSLKVMDHIKNFKLNQTESFDGDSNVISLRDYSNLA
jgi:integrase